MHAASRQRFTVSETFYEISFIIKYAEVASIVLPSEVNCKISSFTHKLLLEELKVSRSMVVSNTTNNHLRFFHVVAPSFNYHTF